MTTNFNYSVELLKELHILTRDGKVNQDSNRKLKQIDHLTQLCFEQIIKAHLKDVSPLSICDVGAGKNYLSFLLWDRYFKTNSDCQIYSLETRADLVEKSKQIAEKINFKSFHPLHVQAINSESLLPEKLDLIFALHACDTATDEAIHLGLKKNAKAFVLVPCCQAEVAAQLAEVPASHKLYPLFRHPLHRREFGSHLTNVLRGLFLESKGYKVWTTEFVGLEHSLKNEVILAVKVQNKNSLAEKALQSMLESFPVKPKVLFA